jgi:hypothetical protein
MPSLSASISSGCQNGAGGLTLTRVSSAAPLDSTYYWSVLNGTAQEFGTSFSPSELPLVVSGLANGSYTSSVTATAPNGVTYTSTPRSFTIACGPALSLDFVGSTPVTTTTGGTVTVRASGGTPPLYAAISPIAGRQQLLPNTQGHFETVFVNVPAGTHNGGVVDSTPDLAQTVAFIVTVDPYTVTAVKGCTDPNADNYNPAATEDDGSCTYTPPVRQPYFDVPKMQSLRYVQPNRTDLPAFDNTLLADEMPLDYAVEGYCQKVEQGDTLVLQCLSNYQGAPVLTIHTCATDAVALTVPGAKVQQGAGQTASFDVYAKPDPTPGFTRLYFNDDALPLPFLPGQRVTISTTDTSLDGTYALHDVLEDASAAVPYLRIVAPYPAGNVRIDATLTTMYVVQQYDTYQFVVPFESIAPGCYYSQITAADNDFLPALAMSEPIEVAQVHRDTKLISYRKFDNDDLLNYSHGLVNRQRVVARLFDRRPTGDKTVLRNDNHELEILQAAVYGKVFFEALLLPSWLHEVLFVAFNCDFVKVDSLRVVLEGDYTYEPVERYTLGKGTALLERRGFQGASNEDDMGGLDAGGGPFLQANDKYLKVLL